MIKNQSALRPIAFLGLAAVMGLGMVACGGGSPAASETAPASESSTPLATASASPSATASSSAAAAAGGSGTAKETTKPGTKLTFGKTANTHTNTGKDPADPKYVEATFTSTVTKIVAGTEADLSSFKDAAKFAGQTPYYVFTDHTLESLSKPSAGISEPKVGAQLKDGTDAQKLIVFGAMDQCKDKRFETTGKGDDLSLKVGSTMTSCQVFLAPAGDAVAKADYTDAGFVYASYSDNPFRKNPIVWSE